MQWTTESAPSEREMTGRYRAFEAALGEAGSSREWAGDVVTMWTRDGGKRLRRMIAEVHDRGITTLDEILPDHRR